MVGHRARGPGVQRRRTYGQPRQGPISRLWAAFVQRNLLLDIPNQAQPGEIVCVYTDHESDQDGDYLALLGRTVTSLDSIPEGMSGKLIPAQMMAAIDVAGNLQTTIPATWERALPMFTPDYRLQRTFVADLDIYPVEPSGDGPTATILIGIHPPGRN